MRKNNIRDYATAAFAFWGRCGCPSCEEIERRCREWTKAERLDLCACAFTFSLLEKKGEGEICDAVREVYIADLSDKVRRGDISAKVVKFSMKAYVSERQVYNWLRDACVIFAKYRHLRLEK